MMTNKVRFYDPHPGLKGAIAPLPETMRNLAQKLDGQTMALEEATEKIFTASKKIGGKAEIVKDKEYISFEFNQGLSTHSYCLIKYKKI